MQRFVKSTRRRGFTLMELLVVLAILVLLMAMVAPRILGLQGKASIKTAKTQLGLFESALDNYAVEVGSYPTSEQGLQALLSPPAAGGQSMSTGMGSGMDTGMGMGMDTGMTTTMSGGGGGNPARWDGPYLNTDSIPNDPWGLPYGYAYPPTRGVGPKPDIWSFGPDSMDGTEDDIVNWTRGASGTGQGLPGENNPLGTDPMGGQLGPEGLPGQAPMNQGMPPSNQGMPPMGGGNMPPAGGGNMPPMGGGTGPMGGGTGTLPPGPGPMPQQQPGNF